MQITRQPSPATRTRALALDMARMHTSCVGCTDCRGFCQALIEALVLPDVILHRGRTTPE